MAESVRQALLDASDAKAAQIAETTDPDERVRLCRIVVRLEELAQGLRTRAVTDVTKSALRTASSLNKKPVRWAKTAGVPKKITPHVFRRCAVDMLRQAQVDVVVARSLVGHATAEMTERYSKVVADEQRAALGKVLSLIGDARS